MLPIGSKIVPMRLFQPSVRKAVALTLGNMGPPQWHDLRSPTTVTRASRPILRKRGTGEPGWQGRLQHILELGVPRLHWLSCVGRCWVAFRLKRVGTYP